MVWSESLNNPALNTSWWSTAEMLDEMYSTHICTLQWPRYLVAMWWSGEDTQHNWWTCTHLDSNPTHTWCKALTRPWNTTLASTGLWKTKLRIQYAKNSARSQITTSSIYKKEKKEEKKHMMRYIIEKNKNKSWEGHSQGSPQQNGKSNLYNHQYSWHCSS